jgi:pseudaminic acid synthase
VKSRTPFIIAEVGANHHGSLTRALELVDAAARAGADSVKFQCWTPDTMSYDYRLLTVGPWAGVHLPGLYRNCLTPWAWFPVLFERAMSQGLIPFASAFDIEAVQFLEKMRCPIHKVASNEITDHQLIRAMAKTGKHMIISTGCATIPDIGAAVRMARSNGCDHITLLKCTSEYPAKIEDANLATMRSMASRWGCDAGLSDHTVGSVVAITAAALGATVIEKHLTLARSDGGPDAAFSMEPAEFMAMVADCRLAVTAVGIEDYPLGPHPYLRTLWVVKDIAAGETFSALNVRTARPNKGMDCREIGTVYGRVANVAITAGTPLTRNLIGSITP